MASGIDAALVLAFDDQLQYAFQQQMPRLRQYVRVRTNVIGIQASFDVLGASEADDITGRRHAMTQWLDPQNTRRWAPKRDLNHPVLLDWNEPMEILIDLEQGYAMNGAMAMARAADRLILESAIGVANEGATGTTTSAFDTTALSADGLTGGLVVNGATGLTVSKVRAVRGAFMAREVGMDDIMNRTPDAFVWPVSGVAMRQLMAETEAISSDFVNSRPMEDGFIYRFMGFMFVVTSLLSTVASMRRTIAWHKQAMGYALWKERDLTVDRIPTMNNATGIQYLMSHGSVRIQSTGVIAVDIDETK